MEAITVKRPLNRPPTHLGDVLREYVLPTLELSIGEAARQFGISRQQFYFERN